jgi:phosphate transport system permease protein
MDLKKKNKKKPFDMALMGITWGFAVLTLSSLLFIVGHILVNGITKLRPSLFEMHWTTENVSMMPSILSTTLMVIVTLALVVPLGMFTSIFLVEYAKKGSRYVKVIRQATEILAGIPSIVYGLFGSLFFVSFLGLGLSLLAGSLTLSIMVLPLVIRTTEEALMSVSGGYREGAFALGSGKLRVIFRIVLPSAIPGVLAGVILATGRIVGETAALIFTAGTAPNIPGNIFGSVRTLAVHMWSLSGEALHTDEAYATAVVLLLIVLIINTVAAAIAKALTPGRIK